MMLTIDKGIGRIMAKLADPSGNGTVAGRAGVRLPIALAGGGRLFARLRAAGP